MRDFLQVFAICSALVSSYLWIRLSWWRSFKTIRALSRSNSDDIARDLISQKADCEISLAGLILAAIAQALTLFISPTINELSGLSAHQGWTFLILLFVLYLVGNIAARIREKILRAEYYRELSS